MPLTLHPLPEQLGQNSCISAAAVVIFAAGARLAWREIHPVSDCFAEVTCLVSCLLNRIVECFLILKFEMSEAHEKDKHVGKEEEELEEEEYILLELDDCLYSDISPGAPFMLSGLDTLTPTLVVGDGMKMIGEYEETVGTCYLFSENETQPKPNAEMPPSGENKDKPDSSSKEAPPKEVKHLASVEKILKFRPASVDHQQGKACQHRDREI